MDDWADLTERTLREIETVDPVYRPTNFWAPGLEALVADLEARGLESFKSWPTATWWFYPTYGSGFTADHIAPLLELAEKLNPAVRRRWLEQSLLGEAEARRDLDAVRLRWNRGRWPFDLRGFGESALGQPVQHFHLTDSATGWTKPYLNYLICLSALSQHVDAPPSSVLEIGGGFGVLGEILMQRDAGVRYVDLDIPPLVTVASYYLRSLFGDRVAVYDRDFAGPLDAESSGVLPNWRIDDVAGPFDVFVNSFSFQEMEPEVVEHYVAKVAEKEVEFVVSLNSRRGKPTAAEGGIGVIDQVTSARIIEMFEKHGYRLLRTYGQPLLHSAGQLAVLRR